MRGFRCRKAKFSIGQKVKTLSGMTGSVQAAWHKAWMAVML